MKKISFMILILAGCFFGTTTLFAETNSSQPVPFDGRKWVVGSHDANELQKVTEYIPEGQVIEKWTELVTVSEFIGIQNKSTPEELMTSMMQMASENCNGIKKNVIKTSKTDLIFEWETNGCKPGIPGGETPEFDISRIIFAKDRVYMMQYASKIRLNADKRDEWIKILSLSVFDGTEDFKKFQKEIANPQHVNK